MKKSLSKNRLEDEIILDDIFFQSFFDWLEFDLDDQQYNTKYKDNLISLWAICFLPGLSLSQTFTRLKKLNLLAQNSTLKIWVKSLSFHFFYYIFCYHDSLTIYSISKEFNFKLKDILFDLRLFVRNQMSSDARESVDFFFLNHQVVDLDWNLNHIFLLNAFGRCQKFESKLRNNKLILTKDLVFILNEMNSEFVPTVHFDYINKFDKYLKRGVRYFLEGVTIIFVFYLGTILINKSNIYWETLLTNKIKVFEPQFKWLKKGLAYNRVEGRLLSEKTIKPKDFNIRVKNLNSMVSSQFNNWSETESETTLSSLDIIPKSIDESDYEVSAYEETKKSGYRDSRFGSTKVYRVVINSPVSPSLGDQLKALLHFYKAAKVDNVEPGQMVPGGNYYNIFIPREFLKEFLSKIMDLGESFLYESRTRTRRNPPGQNKVFIWVKNI